MAAEDEVTILRDDEKRILNDPTAWKADIQRRADLYAARVQVLGSVISFGEALEISPSAQAELVDAFRLRNPGMTFEAAEEMARAFHNLVVSLPSGKSDEADIFNVLPGVLRDTPALPVGDTKAPAEETAPVISIPAATVVAPAEAPQPRVKRQYTRRTSATKPATKTKQTTQRPETVVAQEAELQGEPLDRGNVKYLHVLIGEFDTRRFTTADAGHLAHALLAVKSSGSPLIEEILTGRFENILPTELGGKLGKNSQFISNNLFAYKASILKDIRNGAYTQKDAAARFFEALAQSEVEVELPSSLSKPSEILPNPEASLHERLARVANRPREDWLKDVIELTDGISVLDSSERQALFTRITFDEAGLHKEKTDQTRSALNKLQAQFAEKGPDWLKDQPLIRTILQMALVDIMNTNDLDAIFERASIKYPQLTKNATELLLAIGIDLLTKED